MIQLTSFEKLAHQFLIENMRHLICVPILHPLFMGRDVFQHLRNPVGADDED